MTCVTVISENPGSTDGKFRASTRDLVAVGQSAGAALDSLTRQMQESEAGTIVIVQNFKPDQFFTKTQLQRLNELMERWRDAQNRGSQLDPTEQAELEALIDAEIEASGNRAAAIADELLP